MPVNKVIFGDQVIIDITDTTVTPTAVASGQYFYDKTGTKVQGIGSALGHTTEVLANGGTAHYISGVDLGEDTVSADNLLSGYTAHDKDGNSVVGTASAGQSSYILLTSAEMEVIATGSTETNVDSILISSNYFWNNSNMLYIKIRDKAGPRQGYYFGADYFINFEQTNPGSGTLSEKMGTLYKTNSTGVIISTRTAINYGVFVKSVVSSGYSSGYSTGSINIYKRYSSSYTGTVNGTFKIDIYALNWPDGISPFINT